MTRDLGDGLFRRHRREQHRRRNRGTRDRLRARRGRHRRDQKGHHAEKAAGTTVRRHGGPADPRARALVLYSAKDVASVIDAELDVQRAEAVERPVQTETGPAVAIDCLVRAQRRSEA